MSPPRSEAPRPITPWATVLVAVLALILTVSRAWEQAWIFDRPAILHGEWWRLWTGNFVHFGALSLWGNLAVLVPAGIWVERIAPGRTRWMLALAPGLIGALLLMLEPTLLHSGRSLFAPVADPGLRPVPLAAVAGVVSARGAYLWRRRI